jgi:hypothetical protein
MLKHIVLFKLKPAAEGASKEENAKKIKRDLEALKGVIPQIRHIEVGINVIPSETAYDIAIYSEFADEKDLNIYMKHPEHVKVAEYIGKVRESRVVVDYVL